jgi:hypothetical protein
MGVIKKSEIRGYLIDGKLLCGKCTADVQKDWASEEQILLANKNLDDKENLYFCDECKKRL